MYGRVKQEPPRVEHSVMSDLLKDEDAILDLNQLVNQLNGEGKIISVDDILSRQKYVKSAFDLNRSPSTQNAEAINTNPQDVIPKVVTNIQCEEGDAQSSYDGLLLDDLAREMRKQDQSESSVVIMHHDVLDDMKDAEVEDKALRDEILKQRAVLLSDEGIRIESVSQPAAVSSATNASPRLSPRASPRASSGLTGRASISNPFPSPLLPPQPPAPKEKKKKGKKVRGHRTAKENIVAVDDVIRESTTVPLESPRNARSETQSANADAFHFFDADGEYVDLSQQMIHSINQTTFSGNPVSENVNVTYFNASPSCLTKDQCSTKSPLPFPYGLAYSSSESSSSATQNSFSDT